MVFAGHAACRLCCWPPAGLHVLLHVKSEAVLIVSCHSQGATLQVVPSGYGQRLVWYFPVLPSYWRGHSSAKDPKSSHDNASGEGLLSGEASGGAAVAVRHLCKDFRTTDGYTKRAVDDLSLDVAAGKVTALLGKAFPHTNQVTHEAWMHGQGSPTHDSLGRIYHLFGLHL